MLYQRTGHTGPTLRAGLGLLPVSVTKKATLRQDANLSLITTAYNCKSKHAQYSRTGLYNTTYTADLVSPASSVGSCISFWEWDTTQAHTACPFPACSCHGGKQLHSTGIGYSESYYHLIHHLSVILTFDSFFFLNQIHPRLKTK